jgi:hypothetical protein
VDKFIVFLKEELFLNLPIEEHYKFIHNRLWDHKCFGIKINRLCDMAVYIYAYDMSIYTEKDKVQHAQWQLNIQMDYKIWQRLQGAY